MDVTETLDEAPVSLQQRTMLGGVTHSPTPWVFNVPTQIRLAGPLDVDALRWALDQLAARHVALRCRFVMIDEDWRQQELPPGPVPLSIVDVRGRTAAEQEHAVDRACRMLARTPFDLGQGTFPRCRLLRLDAEQWVLMIVLHHISVDAWAIRTMYRDLSEFYRSAVVRAIPRLPVPVRQCTDYARWQVAHTDRTANKRKIEALKREMLGKSARVELPTDRPRAVAASGTGGTVRIPVSGSVRKAAEELARRRHTTPFSVIAAAFARWLSRQTGRTEIVLVMGFSDRPRLEFESMLTFAASVLAVPLVVKEAASFTDSISTTALGILKALDDAVPLNQVLSDVPNVTFNFMHTFEDAVTFTGVETVAVHDLAPPASRRELTMGIVQFEDVADGYQAWMEYSGDLWDKDAALALLRDYVTLLETLCAQSA
ncbi:hypothetical protein GCM10022223_32830 [Kineosporia mesophila]|uniref:Condensation domain-containing protein n=1 Tax=Kineosporia mesophila TaxID=566012 RepID=A0ABP6ZPN7_9ACTN|nr:condensation domain-containing protein [Kineosporia mesophila]MCD5353720.1 condensation domain-containing protein [Kineosporia mesophila]